MTDSDPLTFPLETARLRLRPHTDADAAWLHTVYSRPEVARFLLDEPWSTEDAARHAQARTRKTGLHSDAGALALVIEHEGTQLGDVGLWFTDRERKVAEIGWVLDPDHGGRGLASEAVREVVRIGFDQYGLHRVVAQMDARNTASAKLAARVGLRQEAHLRQDWWNKGEWTDTLVYAVLATDR